MSCIFPFTLLLLLVKVTVIFLYYLKCVEFIIVGLLACIMSYFGCSTLSCLHLKSDVLCELNIECLCISSVMLLRKLLTLHFKFDIPSLATEITYKCHIFFKLNEQVAGID